MVGHGLSHVAKLLGAGRRRVQEVGVSKARLDKLVDRHPVMVRAHAFIVADALSSDFRT